MRAFNEAAGHMVESQNYARIGAAVGLVVGLGLGLVVASKIGRGQGKASTSRQ